MELEKKIREKLMEIMELDDVGKISLEEDLREYGMDSLNAIELVVALEMEFEMKFDEDDLLVDNLCTIQKLQDAVKKYVNE